MKESLSPQSPETKDHQAQEKSLRARTDPDKKKPLDRQAFLKISGATILGVSLYKTFQQLGVQPQEIFNQTSNDFWPQKELSSLKKQALKKTSLPTQEANLTSQTSPTPTSSLETNQNSSEQAADLKDLKTPTVEKQPENPFSFLEIDFSNPKQPISMLITTNKGDKIQIPSFEPHGWSPQVDEKNIFNPRNNTSVAWIDQNNRIGLWLHSGRLSSVHSGFTMWNTQKYLEEKNNQGHRRTPQELKKLLSEQIINSQVFIKQEKTYKLAKITAAVRIPPHKVEESTNHVIDMVSYLADNFPGSGFEKIKNKSEILLPKFCGRHLVGENIDPKRPEYQQSRFVFAIEKA